MSKLDLTKPVQTRSGRKVLSILCADLVGPYRIVARMEAVDGIENVETFTADGQRFQHTPSSGDLINIPEKRTLEGFINIYSNGIIMFNATRAEADALSNNRRTECLPIKIEYVEGQGLDGKNS